MNMHSLFIFGILLSILSGKNNLFSFLLVSSFNIGVLSVHPGDPFPTGLSGSKTVTSEDLIKVKEGEDPNDDKIPLTKSSITSSNGSCS